MKIIEENQEYRLQSWVTTCSNCNSVYEFDEKDIEMQIYGCGNGGYESKYFVRCPVCGNYYRIF